MVFSSVIFLCCFLPLMLLAYYVSPKQVWLRNLLLLLGSLFFYAWGGPTHVFVMLLSIVGNYCFGRLLHAAKLRGRGDGFWLGIAVAFNLGLLFYFKYFNFAVETAVKVFGLSMETKFISLPIGISFFTFQGMSYVIDVYREKVGDPDGEVVQKDFVKLALYISMFPQLIAGPIVRYHDIRPYLDERKVNLAQFSRGIERFILGLAKKVLFANLLGDIATQIMHHNGTMISQGEAWLGALCYAMQIYYDFSGYSDMAIGLGRMFGFEFLENFNYPYISRSITEFWRRWHISLSQWFRDYLYIPLGGNRRGNVYVNLSIVFLATGIWHGADWGFLLWGIWHGAFILIERVLKKRGLAIRVPAVLGWAYTMFVVLMGWVLFGIVDLKETGRYLGLMFGLRENAFVSYKIGWYLNRRTAVMLVLALLCCVPWKEWLVKRFPRLDAEQVLSQDRVVLVKRVLLLLLYGICLLFIVNSNYNPFIYFRF